MFNSSSNAFHARQTLTPSSESSLNSENALPNGLKRRRGSGSPSEEFLKDPFVVKPYPPKGPTRPRTLQPLLLLPRSHLPLSSLDLNPSSRPLPASRLFETDVKILDLEERMGNEPMVLIARLDDGLTLYAVERQDRGLYVVCQLGSWVNIPQLRAVAVVSRQEVKAVEKKFASGGPGAAPLVPAPSSIHSKRKRLAIDAVVSMVKRPCAGLSSRTPTSAEPIASPQLPPILQISNPEPPMDEIPAQLAATEIFETVRTQYFEALYLSKASLAYFAKGPLSRARAAFHLDYDSALDMNEYITFLESVALSINLIDKKYKEGLPKCVSEIDMHDDSAEDVKGKKKKTKKMKPGRTGLYPLEDKLVRKWWADHDDEPEYGAPGSSRDHIAKSRIAQLRIRETQLQMIILLEVLALQPLTPTSEDMAGSLPNSLPAGPVDSVKESPAKAKKMTQLTTLVDVHIDRLCIWQSLDLAVETPIEPPSNINGKFDGARPKSYTDNPLRDFCVDIIGPFFSSRLPEKCATINRKLGGPVNTAPSKPKLPKSSSFSGRPSKPGAATKRAVPAKPRQSLKRVLTDDRERRSGSMGYINPPGLMRSATDPVKREGSEAPSLSGIPTADLNPRHKTRTGILASKHFSRREVDMKRLAPDPNAKAMKQAKADAELRDAILAIKKPNRELAGKSLADTAQKRAVPGPQGRKSKKPIRNPLFEGGVQISATPRAHRHKDIFSTSTHTSLHRTTDEMDVDVIPPSSAPRIPQSVIRPRAENLRDAVQATPTRRSSIAPDRMLTTDFKASIHATPTRKSSLTHERSNGLLGVPRGAHYENSSPLLQRHYAGAAQNNHGVIPDSAVKNNTASSSFIAHETPLKKKKSDLFSTSNKENAKSSRILETASTADEAKDEDIYKTLGWDNDDDDDELA